MVLMAVKYGKDSKEKSKELVVNASKILPGGEQATGGSWLSAGLLAYGGIKAGKALGTGKLLGKLGSGAAETVTSAAKSSKTSSTKC